MFYNHENINFHLWLLKKLKNNVYWNPLLRSLSSINGIKNILMIIKRYIDFHTPHLAFSRIMMYCKYLLKYLMHDIMLKNIPFVVVLSFITNWFFSHSIYPIHSFPSVQSSQLTTTSTVPQIKYSSISYEKRIRLQEKTANKIQ